MKIETNSKKEQEMILVSKAELMRFAEKLEDFQKKYFVDREGLNYEGSVRNI